MQDSGQLLGYVQQGIDALLEQEGFDGGQEFRRTQKQALEAYQRYLSNDNYTTEEKLKGFFEIPTGVGKTAVFVGIIAAAQKAAQEDGEEFKTIIVVPTLTLLNQTLEAFQGNDKAPDDEKYFAGFAPRLKNKIGLYGGRKKNLKLPFTIMTYDAWALQLENGNLNPDDVDILITDEGHRGTSEKRIDLSTQFNGGSTLQLSFTATAEFDEEKSVYNSHERRIFYKPVADSIRERELAAYVSSQRLGIRVDPTEYMLSDEFRDASFERKVVYRQAAKQNAWNKRMLKVFREGTDQKTGDALSDNQAGFFVEGIRQADKMEAMLNEDAELNAKARSMGYEGVAVAIHSSLSPTEQERRMEAYQEGKYLAVIGDEKFKEGFDHPPMKTIFDCPHESKVDKAQIIGRGLRKWWNKSKDRWEGLTVIESLMYFANEDPDKELDNKENAKMRSISVKQIIGELHIDSPDSPTYGTGGNSNGSGGSGGGHLFDDDPDVEEYTTLDELYELEAETDELRKAQRLKEEALWKNNPLTMADIKETIDAYREENDSASPASKSGKIYLGPLAEKIHWGGLETAISNGSNGLNEDKSYQEWCGIESKPSIYRLLIHLGHVEEKEDLTMVDIKKTVEAYREENNGRNPHTSIGKITLGALAGRVAWAGLNSSLKSATNGLDQDETYQEWFVNEETPSLSRLLIHWGYAKEKTSLTMADIKATVEAYREANDNKNPLKTLGDVTVGPLAGRTTWAALSSAIISSLKGLSEDFEYNKFLETLDTEEIPSLPKIFVYFKFSEKPLELTIADIKTTITAYRKENDGKNPTVKSRDITSGPLVERTTWDGINSALTVGGYGLKGDESYRKWIQIESKPSLFRLLVHFEYAQDTRLTVENIIDTIKAYIKSNKEKTPSNKSGAINVGSLAGTMTWRNLTNAVATGGKGLSNDTRYKKWISSVDKPSWAEFLEHFDFKKKPLKLTIVDVKASIEAYRKENNGKNPSTNSGEITTAPLAGRMVWNSVNTAIAKGQSSLTDDLEYKNWIKTEPKPSISKLCKKMDTEKQQQITLRKPPKNNGLS